MTDVLDTAFATMFKNLPPEVAERVRAKYEADREEFVTFARGNTPSNAPGYWAAKSCTKCLGRGIIGELTTPKGKKEPLVCYCVSRTYQKWLTEQRKLFNQMKKEQGNESTRAEAASD